MKQPSILSLFALLVALLSSGASTAQAVPRVAASIKPLQFIAMAVMEGLGSPVLLMNESGDPHHYTLRPSDRRALENSELILWIGPELERPLARVLEQVAGEKLTAISLEELHLLEVDGQIDHHLWLDIDNALKLATHLVSALSMRDPANASRYEENLRSLRSAAEDWEQALLAALAAIESPRPFAVYHNAYRYLEDRYGLRHEITFTDHEEVSPGIRQLLSIREQIRQDAIGCVLVEPGVNIPRLRGVLSDGALRLVEVDFYGRHRPASPHAYIEMMQHVGDALIECLN